MQSKKKKSNILPVQATQLEETCGEQIRSLSHRLKEVQNIMSHSINCIKWSSRVQSVQQFNWEYTRSTNTFSSESPISDYFVPHRLTPKHTTSFSIRLSFHNHKNKFFERNWIGWASVPYLFALQIDATIFSKFTIVQRRVISPKIISHHIFD